MESSFEELIYEFHAKDLSHPEALKQYADQAVKEIKSTYGWGTYVQIKIESEARDKRVFAVSMSVFGLREPIVAKKAGRHVLSTLRKVSDRRKPIIKMVQEFLVKASKFRTNVKTSNHLPLEMAG